MAKAKSLGSKGAKKVFSSKVSKGRHRPPGHKHRKKDGPKDR